MIQGKRWVQVGQCIALIFGLGMTTALASPPRLNIETSYQLNSTALTTERVWMVDPGEKNPHLQRWAIARQAQLLGLQAEKKGEQKFGISARQVKASAMGSIRGPGPWYRSWAEYECSGKIGSEFADLQGTERAAAASGDLWTKLLKEKLPELEVFLSRVSAASEAQALDRGEQVFKVWLLVVEDLWRAKSKSFARSEEVRYYRETAQVTGNCRSASVGSLPRIPRSALMEPVQGPVPKQSKLLARAPARLWNGLFSIRATLTFAGKHLNGRFLVDSSAPTSQISPAWLDAQGIYPAWIYAPNTPPEGVQRSGVWQGERSLARKVRAERVEVSGLSLPLREFLLTETEFFNPPESVGTCCDGVLGLDFLRLYPMEFRSAAPAEVRVWTREGYRGGEDAPWLELSELPTGEISSECQLVAGEAAKSASSAIQIQGVSWDLGNEEGLKIHTPWRSFFDSALKLSKKMGAPQLVCDRRQMATDISPSFPQPPIGMSELGLLGEKNPGMTVGMSLLGQTSFTLDLPHGRIWFSPGSLPLKEKPKNTSGLRLTYELQDNDRLLRVTSLDPQSPARALGREGLSPRAIVTQVDFKPVEEMDQWEVNQRLSGIYGSRVTLQWKTKKGLKVATLRLADGE